MGNCRMLLYLLPGYLKTITPIIHQDGSGSLRFRTPWSSPSLESFLLEPVSGVEFVFEFVFSSSFFSSPCVLCALVSSDVIDVEVLSLPRGGNCGPTAEGGRLGPMDLCAGRLGPIAFFGGSLGVSLVPFCCCCLASRWGGKAGPIAAAGRAGPFTPEDLFCCRCRRRSYSRSCAMKVSFGCA